MGGARAPGVDVEPDALGLQSGTVLVVPWDARWPTLFAEASRELEHALGPEALAIHHVGSTAVPGLAAKPILDILVSVASLEGGLALVPRIEALGYEFRPDEDIPDRHYFRRRRGTVRTHHLSLAEPASWHHRATLAFRDALRRDPARALAYGELKRALARRHPNDRPAYLEGKTAFVQRVLDEVGVSWPPIRP